MYVLGVPLSFWLGLLFISILWLILIFYENEKINIYGKHVLTNFQFWIVTFGTLFMMFFPRIVDFQLHLFTRQDFFYVFTGLMISAFTILIGGFYLKYRTMNNEDECSKIKRQFIVLICLLLYILYVFYSTDF